MDAIKNPAGPGLPAQSLVALRLAAAWPSMPAAQRQFAELVRRAPLRLARLSIHEAVAEAGVSVATANRFATALGFDGYPEFRAALIRAFEALFAPVERLERGQRDGDSPLGVLAGSLNEDRRNLERTLAGLDDASAEAALGLLAGAGRIYVAGFDLAAHLAGLFAIGLGMAGCRAEAATGGGGNVGAVRQLVDLGPGDLVVAIAFPSYFRDTIAIARLAQDLGVPVLAITDGPGSPLVPLARAALYVTAEHEFNPPSSTAIVGLLEALAAAVALRRPEAARTGRRFAELAWPWMIPPDGK